MNERPSPVNGPVEGPALEAWTSSFLASIEDFRTRYPRLGSQVAAFLLGVAITLCEESGLSPEKLLAGRNKAIDGLAARATRQ